MGLIICPDCGGQVSDKAKVCIHCGAPLIEEKSIIKIKAPSSKGVLIPGKYTITNDSTGEVMGIITDDEVASLELNEPTTIRCHISRGIKDGVLEYTPNGGVQRYAIQLKKTWVESRIILQEVDIFDSDN